MSTLANGRTEENMTFANEVTFQGPLNFSAVSTVPMSALSDSAADLTAQKVTQQRVYYENFAAGNPATGTYPLPRCTAPATLKSFTLYIGDAPASGTLTVDLHKCDGVGGAYATVLSAALTSTSADTDRTVKSASLSNTSNVSGGVYAIVVTAGTGAAQICATAIWEEAAAS